MHLAAVPIVGRLISLAGSKMKRPRNLFVEQNTAHWMYDGRLNGDRELGDVAVAGGGIENIVQFLGLVARSVDNLSFLEFQPDMVKSCALLNCRGVKGDEAVDRVAHRSRKNFPVRNISIAAADDGRNFFNAESQVRSWACDLNPVGSLH